MLQINNRAFIGTLASKRFVSPLDGPVQFEICKELACHKWYGAVQASEEHLNLCAYNVRMLQAFTARDPPFKLRGLQCVAFQPSTHEMMRCSVAELPVWRFLDMDAVQ